MDNSECQNELIVALTRDKAEYSELPPFHPSEHYPEYPFGPENISRHDNSAYRAVRNCFIQLNMDVDNIGQTRWNPLGQIISPGDTVILKPNFVIDRHDGGGSIFSVITHPSVIRVVADFCWIALCGAGRLIVADAPLDECDFNNLLKVTKLKEISRFFDSHGKIKLEIIDLRNHSAVPGKRMYAGYRRRLKGDPDGSVVIDLGKDSALYGKKSFFFGVDYNVKETQRNHHGQVHRYQLSKTVLACDVLISIPKLKVHKLVGATLNLKGMVGITTNKNYLVHYSVGTSSSGGDQFMGSKKSRDKLILGMRQRLNRLLLSGHVPLLERLHYRVFHSRLYGGFRSFLNRLGIVASRDVEATDGGKWFGNDTCWRMVADLARIIHFSNKQGDILIYPQRRLFSVVDGIIGGDGNGPLVPRSRPEGVVACGQNLVAVDIACMCLMGFDPCKFPLYNHLMLDGRYGFSLYSKQVIARSDIPELARIVTHSGRNLGFEPHPNWKGHIEMELEEKSSPSI